MLKVKDIYEFIDSIAPYDTQESFDNSGLNVGKKDRDVHAILVTLDVTQNAVEEAIKVGADLIVSHHPLLFHARKDLTEDDPEGRILCRLVRNNISVISAHTNLDLSGLSGSACIARGLKLSNIRPEGFLYIGETEKSITAEELGSAVEQLLGVSVRIYGNKAKRIDTIAVAGGAYDIGYTQAMEAGADILITGEVRHHNALAASMDGFVLMDATHYGTERILVPILCDTLQNSELVVKYNVKVYPSEQDLFS